MSPPAQITQLLHKSADNRPAWHVFGLLMMLREESVASSVCTHFPASPSLGASLFNLPDGKK